MAALLNVPLLLPLISGWLLQGITAKDGGGLADTILNFSDNQTCPVRLLPAKTLSRGQFAGTYSPGCHKSTSWCFIHGLNLPGAGPYSLEWNMAAAMLLLAQKQRCTFNVQQPSQHHVPAFMLFDWPCEAFSLHLYQLEGLRHDVATLLQAL